MVGLTVQKQLSEQSGMNGKKYLDSRAGTSGGKGQACVERGGAENPAAEWGRGWDTLESA